MTLILLSVVALCPIIACPLAADSHSGDSCCHKPQSHPDPCPAKSIPDCPYTILQKSNANPGSAYAPSLGVLAQTAHISPPLVSGHVAPAPLRLADSAGLYLRNCVLLV